MPTKTKILDAAEAIFAEHGISNSSLRSIVAKAGVNVAAVHYHFGSKEALVQAVFARRINVVNENRMQLLSTLKEEFGSDPIPIKKLLRAFISPAIKMGQDVSKSQRNFLSCIARAHAETEEVVQAALYDNLKEILNIFLIEIQKSCPQYSDKERLMRFSFSAGAMVHTMLMPLKTAFVERFFEEGIPHEEICEMLVDFCAAGLSAASVSRNKK